MRLIDADALLDHAWKDKLDTRELIAEMIENAPTVVPVYEKTGEKVEIQCDGKIEIPFEVLSDFGLSIVALQKCVDESVDEVVDESVDKCHFLCRHNENMRCKIGRNGAKCLKETLGYVGEKRMTYGDIAKQFYDKFPNAEADDWRPADPMFISQLSRPIPNAILVWLKDGSKLVFISGGGMNES